MGRVRISRLNPERIRAYRATREAEGTSPSTRNRELGVLRALLHRAVSDGRLRRDALPLSWGGEPEPRRDRVLSLGDEAALLATMSGWQRFAVIVLLGTGARVMELLSATVDQVQADDGASGYLTVSAPKEGQPKRLRVRNGAWWALRNLMAGRQSGLIVHPEASPRANYKSLQRALYAGCRRCQIPPVHLHDLRRTMGTRLAAAGAPGYVISGVLGHTNERTLRHYVRLAGAQYDGWLDRVVESGRGSSTSG